MPIWHKKDVKKMSEKPQKVLSVKDIAALIAEKLSYTAGKGKMQVRKSISPRSPSVSCVLTPAHQIDDGSTIPALYHVEFKSPMGGAVISVRTEKDLQKLVYLREHRVALDTLIDLGRSAITLNPENVAVSAESDGDQPLI